MADLLVVLSVASAHIMTNLDNLAILLAMLAAGGHGRAVLAFAAVQVAVIGLAAVLGEALAGAAGRHLGMLGALPIGLGIYQILSRSPADPAGAPRPALGAQIAVFAGCSADSLAVLTALFADSTDRFDVSIGLGAILSVLLVTGLALALGTRLGGPARRLEPLAPYVMIAAGIYVLLNTPTDFA